VIELAADVDLRVRRRARIELQGHGQRAALSVTVFAPRRPSVLEADPGSRRGPFRSRARPAPVRAASPRRGSSAARLRCRLRPSSKPTRRRSCVPHWLGLRCRGTREDKTNTAHEHVSQAGPPRRRSLLRRLSRRGHRDLSSGSILLSTKSSRFSSISRPGTPPVRTYARTVRQRSGLRSRTS